MRAVAGLVPRIGCKCSGCDVVARVPHSLARDAKSACRAGPRAGKGLCARTASRNRPRSSIVPDGRNTHIRRNSWANAGWFVAVPKCFVFLPLDAAGHRGGRMALPQVGIKPLCGRFGRPTTFCLCSPAGPPSMRLSGCLTKKFCRFGRIRRRMRRVSFVRFLRSRHGNVGHSAALFARVQRSITLLDSNGTVPGAVAGRNGPAAPGLRSAFASAHPPRSATAPAAISGAPPGSSAPKARH